LIFALPPGEAAFRPSDENGVHELYFVCDDLDAEIASLAAKGVECSKVQEARSYRDEAPLEHAATSTTYLVGVVLAGQS
jgi:hypothetical protein